MLIGYFLQFDGNISQLWNILNTVLTMLCYHSNMVKTLNLLGTIIKIKTYIFYFIYQLNTSFGIYDESLNKIFTVEIL